MPIVETIQGPPAATIYAANYGIVADLKEVIDGAMTASTTTLTSASASFTSKDVGKIFQIAGAGPAVTPTGTTSTVTNPTWITAMSSLVGIVPGNTITGTGIPAGTTVTGILNATTILISKAATATNAGVTFTISGDISGTITAFTNSTTVTVSATATTTVSGAVARYGSDNTTAVNAAVAAFNSGTPSTLIFPAGYIYCSGLGTVSGQGMIAGGGRGTQGGGTTLVLKPGANVDFATITGKGLIVKELCADGNYSVQSSTARGFVVQVAYVIFKGLFIISMNGHGIEISTVNSVGGHYSDMELRTNQGNGIYMSISTAFDNDFYSVNIGNSGLNGWASIASDNNCTKVHSWGNGTLNSAGDTAGFRLLSGVGGCRFVNCFAENNTGRGWYSSSAGSKGVVISGCDCWQNGVAGVYAFTASYWTITGSAWRENGRFGGAGATNAGICNDTGTGWVVVGNTFFDTQATKTQTYGYAEVGTVTATMLIGNVLRAADLKTGSVLTTSITGILGPNLDLVTKASSQTTVASPGGTASTTAVMAGLAGSITPNTTGKLQVTISGSCSNGTINDGGRVQVSHGTGSAPTNGAALTGTQDGLSQLLTNGVAGTATPFSVTAFITGLTVGTAYWLDLAFNAVTGGTFTLQNVVVVAVEIG